MSIGDGPDYDAKPGHRANVVQQGGALLDLDAGIAPVSADAFTGGTIVVGDAGTSVVPASAAGRYVTITNDGYSIVALGGTLGTFAWDTGVMLWPGKQWAGHVRDDVAAIAPPGNTGLLSVSVGTQ